MNYFPVPESNHGGRQTEATCLLLGIMHKQQINARHEMSNSLQIAIRNCSVHSGGGATGSGVS